MTVTADRRSGTRAIDPRPDRSLTTPPTDPEPTTQPAAGARPSVRTWLRRVAERAQGRVGYRQRAGLAHALRLSGAAVTSYVAALIVLPGTVPVVAALTALLVVEMTLVDMLTSGVQRVISVVAGVSLAIAFSAVVGITWWSLGILIAAAIVVGQLLRLGPHLIEVPISAMLVLAVGGSGTMAADRIVETLIGAAVGVGINVLFPPRLRVGGAARAVGRYADEIAALLTSSATELRADVDSARAQQWLEQARDLTRRIAKVDRAVDQAERSRRLNPRALLLHDSGPSLRAGLDALEHSAVAVRSMFRTIADNVPDPAVITVGGSLRRLDDRAEIEDGVRHAFAAVLADLAGAVAAFGDLVRAEVSDDPHQDEDRVSAALAALDEARVRIIELRLAEGTDPSLWQLNNAVLQAVDRLIAELDVEQQARHRAEGRDALAARRALLRWPGGR